MLKNLIISLVLFCFLTINANSNEDCRPELSLSNTSKTLSQQISENSVKRSTYIYFDQSLSMQGYTKDQSGQKNLYINVMDDLQQIAENIGSKTIYHSFGKIVKGIKENEISKIIKPSFYECKGSTTDCNNQESKIHLPFKAVNLDPDGTYIIVTDLFLSSKQLVGGTLKQLTKPLKKILKNGKSIGIMGVMSSFNGTIYDIPKREGGTVSYSDAQKRPFYIIIIGDQKEINIVKKNLEEQHFIDEDDNYKFSLITSMPVLQNLNQNKLISEKNISNKITKAENFKFNYTNDNLANYQFDINNKNKIKFKFDKNKIIVPGSSGVSNFSIKNFLWSSKEVKCRKIDTSDWKKDRREEISSISQNENEVNIEVFKQLPLKKIFWGRRYFYLMEIFAEKPGNISEAIFNEWSIRDTEAETFKESNPVEFKTLNLNKILKILNSVANEEFEPTLIASISLNFNMLKK